jgi:carboxyl-terminal processing protease
VERDLKAVETRHFRWIIGFAFALLASQILASGTPVASDELLKPDTRHENIGELVTRFVQNSHYVDIVVNDEFSSKVLDRYIDAIDRNHMYLLASDLDFFEKYRYRLDDVVMSQPLTPVFDMYSIYRTRVRERFEFALQQLEVQPETY